MIRRRGFFSGIGIAAVLGAALTTGVAQAQTAGIIRGRVIDQDGRPVESAQLVLSPGARRAISFEDGTFEILDLASGDYTLSAHRIGYQPASVNVALRASALALTITLVAIPAQLDSVRVREKASGIRYSAVVLDQNDVPVQGAEVVAMGVKSNLLTDSLGRFTVPGLSRGTLAVRMRKMGYAAYFNSFRIAAERADTLYMGRLPVTMTPTQINELSGFGLDYWAYRDLEQRQSWKGAMAGAVSREELAQHGASDLCDALPGTASGNKLSLRADLHCKSFPEGITTILVDGVRCEHELLSDFAADQVDLVEYFPGGRDLSSSGSRRSRPVAADFSGSLSAHNCSGPPPVYVIWTRKGSSAHTLAVRTDSTPGPGVPRSIAGTVYDSVAQRPLSGAHVHLADLGRDAVADSLGAFRCMRLRRTHRGRRPAWCDGRYRRTAPGTMLPAESRERPR